MKKKGLTYLSILQLEGYDVPRYIKWCFRNYFKRKIPDKRSLELTIKIKAVLVVALALFISLFLYIWFEQCFVCASLFLIVSYINRFIVYSVAVVLLSLPELLLRKYFFLRTKNRIQSIKDITVIGITGSHGKSSTKEFLYQILRAKNRVLRTPESYNTELGIRDVVDYELDDSYKYFICEMGAYKKGDIGNICNMVNPKYGMLTGITTQHLERFGSLENIISTKFEIVDHINNKDHIVFDLDDGNITEELKSRNIKEPVGFSLKKSAVTAQFSVSNLKFNMSGSVFTINIGSNSYKVESRLFGFSNIKNLLGAVTMAKLLGMNSEDIISAMKGIKPVSNRMELFQDGKTSIVNNTYSSNEAGFKEMIEIANSVKGRKVLVTPGIVELGSEEDKVHEDLGKRSVGVFDEIILVGESNRTRSFNEGTDKKCTFIEDSRKSYFTKVQELKEEYDWIFLENDVTQNY